MSIISKTNLINLVERINNYQVQKSNDPIPTVEEIYNIIAYASFDNIDEVKQAVALLVKSGYLFEIQTLDSHKKLADGFVVSSPGALMAVSNVIAKKLERQYSLSMKVAKSADNIILDQEDFLDKNPMAFRYIKTYQRIKEYADKVASGDYRYSKAGCLNSLSRLLDGEESIDLSAEESLAKGPDSEEAVEEKSAKQHSRAVDVIDQEQYSRVRERLAWSDATRIFDPQFLMRIHFRKYEFKMVFRLVYEGKVKEKKDLDYIEATLTKIEGNVERDPKLKDHLKEIQELKKLVSEQISKLRKGRGKANTDMRGDLLKGLSELF